VKERYPMTGTTTLAMELSSFDDIQRARKWVNDLARTAGLLDPEAAVMAAGELGNNCVEHGGQCPGVMKVGCRQGSLSLQFENRCDQPPDWRTRKPVAVAEFRTGGYGLAIARALARSVRCRWTNGRVVVRAEFV
jgi:anti-sigma regulatory factor (Ser/Thr protein kinase)